MGDVADLVSFIVELVGSSQVIDILQEASQAKRFQCPNCKTIVPKGTNQCPKCHVPLRWFMLLS